MEDRTPNKPSSVGPGTVVSVDGASLWMAMFRRRLMDAQEQLNGGEDYSPSVAPRQERNEEGVIKEEQIGRRQSNADSLGTLDEPESEGRRTPTSAIPSEATPPEAIEATPEVQESLRRSIEQARRLDGLPPAGQPYRWKHIKSGEPGPYLTEVLL